MPSLPRYLYPEYITYREPAISKPSPTINDRFDEKDRSMKKKIQGDQASLSCQKGWTVKQKFRFDTR